MSEPTFVVTMNFNVIKLDSWIEHRKRSDGDYDLIGMGRRREYDADTGVLVSDVTEPTGLTGWSPREAVEPESPSFWARLTAWCRY